MVDMSFFKIAKLYWDEWRFEPWENGSASGLYRKADFIKAGIIGEVGRYTADDYIIWKYDEADIERLFNESKPKKGLMLSRYVFVQPEGRILSRTRMFWLGAKGYAEIYMYTPNQKPSGIFERSKHKRIKDLAYLIDASYNYSMRHKNDFNLLSPLSPLKNQEGSEIKLA